MWLLVKRRLYKEELDFVDLARVFEYFWFGLWGRNWLTGLLYLLNSDLIAHFTRASTLVPCMNGLRLHFTKKKTRAYTDWCTWCPVINSWYNTLIFLTFKLGDYGWLKAYLNSNCTYNGTYSIVGWLGKYASNLCIWWHVFHLLVSEPHKDQGAPLIKNSICLC